MDESKDNQDITVGDDGSMNTGINITVKNDDTETTEPSVNDIVPPTVDQNSTEPELDKNDEDSVESAVNFITSSNSEESNSVVEAPTDDVVEAPAEDSATSDSAVENPIEKEQDEEPEPDQGLAGNTEQSPDNTTSNISTEPLATVSANGMSNNEQANPHEHRNNKKLAIIMTLIIAVLLAGAAVYIYLSAQNNAEETSRTSSTPISGLSQEAELIPATSADVDNTIAEIDQTLSTLDDSELSEDSISDTTLGIQ